MFGLTGHHRREVEGTEDLVTLHQYSGTIVRSRGTGSGAQFTFSFLFVFSSPRN